MKVYKCLNNESPEILDDIFHRKTTYHNLRISNLLILPKTNTLTYGIHIPLNIEEVLPGTCYLIPLNATQVHQY